MASKLGLDCGFLQCVCFSNRHQNSLQKFFFSVLRIHLLKLDTVKQDRAYNRRNNRRGEPRWSALALNRCFRKEMSHGGAVLAHCKVREKETWR